MNKTKKIFADAPALSAEDVGLSGVGLNFEKVEAFPTKVFPKVVAEFITAGAKALPCPPDLIAVSILPVAGAAIGTTRLIELKSGFTQGSSLYVAFVASPGKKKTPAFNLVTAPCFEHQNSQYKAYRHALDDATASTQEEPRNPPQFVLTDATIEAIAENIDRNPRGLLYAQDELAGWVTGMNQYRNGNKGHDREYWLQIWSSAPITVARKKHAPLVISRPLVSVVGGIQPDKLAALSKGADDGFLDRILFSYPASHPFQVSYDDLPVEIHEAYKAIIQSLYNLEPYDIDNEPLVLQPKKDVKEAYYDWLNAHFSEMNQPSFSQRLTGPWAKFEGLCLRFALILEMLYHVAGESSGQFISRRAVEGAISLCDYFKSHAKRVYAHFRSDSREKRLNDLFEYIKIHGGKVSVRTVTRSGVAGIKNTNEAKQLLNQLQQMGIGTLETCQLESGQRTELFSLF